MTPSKLIFFAVLGVFLILVLTLVPYILFSDNDTPEVIVKEADEITETLVEEAPTPRDQSIINYKKGKCLVINRFDCPKGWGPSHVKDCEVKLERCDMLYDSLQKFCNVQCEEELIECQEEMRRLNDSYYYDNLYFRLGYYP
jgi:hypothetical protein